jgi:hypothetical protein
MEFVERLKEVRYATPHQKKKEVWDVEGILNNQLFKFDLRPLNKDVKKGFYKTKADKMVFDLKKQYVIVDVEELHSYLKDNQLKIATLEELISTLEWNIILQKL